MANGMGGTVEVGTGRRTDTDNLDGDGLGRSAMKGRVPRRARIGAALNGLAGFLEKLRCNT